MEDDAIGGEEFEVARDKKGLGIAFSRDLAFAEAGVGVDAPSDFARGDVFITGNFGGNPFALDGFDADDLFKVAAIVTDPLAREGDGGKGVYFHTRK